MEATKAGEATPAFLRELAGRVSDDKRKAEGAVLWEIIQEEVGNELDRRFHAAVTGESQNTIKATIMAEESADYGATRTVSYRVGLVVNNRELEAVVTVPMEVALLDGRYAVMDAFKASLAEQIAGLLLSGFQFPRIKP